jgi:hypothetical protein
MNTSKESREEQITETAEPFTEDATSRKSYSTTYKK